MSPAYISAQRKALISILRDKQFQFMLDCEPHFFRDPSFRMIWDGIVSCVSLGRSVTPDQVKDRIRESGAKHGNLAIEVLGNMMASEEVYPSTIAAILAEKYRQDIIDRAVEELTNADATEASKIESVKKAYDGIMGGGVSGAVEIQDLIHAYFARLESGENSKMVERSIEIHNPHIEAIFGKRLYPAPYAVCAQPGFRKTGMLANLIVECAITRHKNTLVYTFEDTAETFMAKIMAARYALPYQAIIDGTLGEKAQELKNRIHGKGWPIRIDDRQFRFDEWAMDVRRNCMTRKVEMIVVDFIQAFSYNRNHEVAELNMITKGIRQLTKEFMVPIVFASQVNDRTSDKGTGEVVLTSGSAKGSGSINEDVRWLCVIDGFPDQEEKRVKVFKNSWGGCFWKTVQFDGPSGCIMSVGRVE